MEIIITTLKGYYENWSLCTYKVIRSSGSGVRPSSNTSSVYCVILGNLLNLSVLQISHLLSNNIIVVRIQWVNIYQLLRRLPITKLLNNYYLFIIGKVWTGHGILSVWNNVIFVTSSPNTIPGYLLHIRNINSNKDNGCAPPDQSCKSKYFPHRNTATYCNYSSKYLID